MQSQLGHEEHSQNPQAELPCTKHLSEARSNLCTLGGRRALDMTENQVEAFEKTASQSVESLISQPTIMSA